MCGSARGSRQIWQHSCRFRASISEIAIAAAVLYGNDSHWLPCHVTKVIFAKQHLCYCPLRASLTVGYYQQRNFGRLASRPFQDTTALFYMNSTGCYSGVLEHLYRWVLLHRRCFTGKILIGGLTTLLKWHLPNSTGVDAPLRAFTTVGAIEKGILAV